MPYMVSFHPITDNSLAPPISAIPLRSDQRMSLGWYDGSNQWVRRPVTESDWFVPFNIFDNGKKLALFSHTNAADITDNFQDIPSGEYKITFEMDDATLPHGAFQTYDLKWDAMTGNFSMKNWKK